MGKGSKRRPEDKKKIDDNWDRIFNNNKDKDTDDNRGTTDDSSTDNSKQS